MGRLIVVFLFVLVSCSAEETIEVVDSSDGTGMMVLEDLEFPSPGYITCWNAEEPESGNVIEGDVEIVAGNSQGDLIVRVVLENPEMVADCRLSWWKNGQE